MSIKRELNRTKEGEKGGAKRPNKRPARPTPAQKRYSDIRIKNPDLPKTAAAQMAGYSPKTAPCLIEQSPGFATLRERLERAAVTVGVTMESNLQVLKSVMSDESDNRARVSAVKVANEMIGYIAPVHTEVHTTSAIGVLISKLNTEGVSLSELMQGRG